jgi:hypothetical protein
MKSRFRSSILALIALTALALSACTLQVSTSISSDGSGEMIVEIGPEPDELAQLAALDLTIDEVCSPAISASINLPPSTVYTQEARGEEPWCVLSIPFDKIDTLRTVLSPPISALTPNTISLAEDRFIFDVSLDLTRPIEFEDVKLPPTTIEWKLELPGQLAGHNADQVDGNNLTWLVEPGVFRTLRAESTLGEGGIPEGGLSGLINRALGIICLIGLGFTAVVGGMWIFLRRRKQAAMPKM